MEREEALEIARKLYKNSLFLKKDKEAIITLISELKESEDRRISKELIEFLKSSHYKPAKMGRWLAWLEKQGEQKPADKVEPKFKVGDTITDPTDSTFTFHINAIKDGKYMESDKDWILIKEADSDYELVEQKTIKWSEEDKNHVKSILSTIKCCKAQFPNSQAMVEAYNADIEWLKSLKDRVQLK